jgi:hypothetical protein
MNEVPKSEIANYLETLRSDIRGLYSDADALTMAGMNDIEELDTLVKTLQPDANGNWHVPRNSAEFLRKISASRDLAAQSTKELDDGNLIVAAMLALAGQKALSSAAGNLLGIALGKERKNLSLRGKRGAAKRHKPMAELKAWAVSLYNPAEWASANQAAHKLQDKVIAHGRTIGAYLTEENAQRTIAEWFRKSV